MSRQLQAVILAAGHSRRFPANKLLNPLPSGDTLLDRAVQNARQLTAQILLVINDNPRILAHSKHKTYPYVVNREAASGMASSIACGLHASSKADAWAIFLADMPFIQAATLKTLADAWPAYEITQPVYHGQPGHPVIFTRNWFEDLCALSGDCGARELLQDNPAVQRIETGDAGVCIDIDNEADWETHKHRFWI